MKKLSIIKNIVQIIGGVLLFLGLLNVVLYTITFTSLSTPILEKFSYGSILLFSIMSVLLVLFCSYLSKGKYIVEIERKDLLLRSSARYICGLFKKSFKKYHINILKDKSCQKLEDDITIYLYNLCNKVRNNPTMEIDFSSREICDLFEKYAEQYETIISDNETYLKVKDIITEYLNYMCLKIRNNPDICLDTVGC